MNIGILGGAEKRFLKIFEYLQKYNPNIFYFILTFDLYEQIENYFSEIPLKNIITIGNKYNNSFIKKSQMNNYRLKLDKEIIQTSNHPSFSKQIYRYIKNYYYQKQYFKEIDQIRKEKNINVFLGIYSGIIPLYFYLQQRYRDVGIVFCDMDSWFRDIVPKERKYWYRKYSSFNYALENSDYIDFLSPFILEGVRKRGIQIREDSISITPCSFTDYSKCKIGDKTTFQVAFAARLEKDKNPEMFLDAAEILSKKYPDIIFHIMGEGRLTNIIEKRVSESNNKNIVFHGFHPSPPEIFANTSVFISIQSTNNYPSQSVLEAMACGNAIVATDVGDTRMFINENNGILINADVKELCDAIEILYLHRERTKEMGLYAEKYVKENHTIEKHATYYIDLFEKAYKKVIGQ